MSEKIIRGCVKDLVNVCLTKQIDKEKLQTTQDVNHKGVERSIISEKTCEFTLLKSILKFIFLKTQVLNWTGNYSHLENLENMGI